MAVPRVDVLEHVLRGVEDPHEERHEPAGLRDSTDVAVDLARRGRGVAVGRDHRPQVREHGRHDDRRTELVPADVAEAHRHAPLADLEHVEPVPRDVATRLDPAGVAQGADRRLAPRRQALLHLPGGAEVVL